MASHCHHGNLAPGTSSVHFWCLKNVYWMKVKERNWHSPVFTMCQALFKHILIVYPIIFMIIMLFFYTFITELILLMAY